MNSRIWITIACGADGNTRPGHRSVTATTTTTLASRPSSDGIIKRDFLIFNLTSCWLSSDSRVPQTVKRFIDYLSYHDFLPNKDNVRQKRRRKCNPFQTKILAWFWQTVSNGDNTKKHSPSQSARAPNSGDSFCIRLEKDPLLCKSKTVVGTTWSFNKPINHEGITRSQTVWLNGGY